MTHLNGSADGHASILRSLRRCCACRSGPPCGYPRSPAAELASTTVTRQGTAASPALHRMRPVCCRGRDRHPTATMASCHRAWRQCGELAAGVWAAGRSRLAGALSGPAAGCTGGITPFADPDDARAKAGPGGGSPGRTGEAAKMWPGDENNREMGACMLAIMCRHLAPGTRGRTPARAPGGTEGKRPLPRGGTALARALALAQHTAGAAMHGSPGSPLRGAKRCN